MDVSVYGGVWTMERLLSVLLLLTFVGSCCCFENPQMEVVIVPQRDPELEYCSFFGNRAPTAQPGLRNCTWFKERCCCLQQEIEATFGRVKPLKGASLACQRHINALMCYICAPNQNVFYQKERLTVCGEFCDSLYGACKDAILKGSVIGDLYDSGDQFCQSRRFLVSTQRCFTFDISSELNSAPATRLSSWCVSLLLSLFMWQS